MADETYSAMQRQLRIWLRIAFLAGMVSGSLLISAMSVAYFDFDSLPPFVIEKLPLRFQTLWLASLRVHVLAAAISFPVCLASLTRAVKYNGKTYYCCAGCNMSATADKDEK